MSATVEIEQSYAAGWSIPFTGEIYDYAKKIDLQKGYAIKGKFDVNRSRYLKKPFEAIRNRNKRVISIKGAVQTGKTLLADLTVPHWIENDPGGILWLLQDDDFAKNYAKARALPMITSIAAIAAILQSVKETNRHNIATLNIELATMSLMIGGLNEGNVQSLSWQYVIIDEAWMSAFSGLVRQAKSRTTAFPYTSKILIIGQGGEKGDDSNIEHEESNKQEYGFVCPECKKLQQYEWTIQRSDNSWAGVIWDTNEVTKPGGVRKDGEYIGGRWKFEEVAKTARIVCVHCGHNIDDTPANRRLLNDTGDYIVTNPGADPTIDGFHWSAMACIDIKLGDMVKKYLRAKVQEEEHGNRLPLQEFFQKDLGKDWDPNQGLEIRRAMVEPYEINTAWLEEKFRNMTVDCQREFGEFWYIVRAKSMSGESRQLARDKVHSWAEVAEVQKKWGVKDQHVFVDAGYEQTKVLQECVQHGHWGVIKKQKVWLCWVAVKGLDKDTWPHRVQNAKGETATQHKVYSEPVMMNPSFGKQGFSGLLVPFYMWSNLNIKDTLRRHRDGKASKFLCLPCEDRFAKDELSYTSQMNSERCVTLLNERAGKKTRIWKQITDKKPNHWWDCECMQILFDYIVGIIGDSPIEIESEVQNASS